ncbi:MAG: glycosyltransferase family 1 protein, partial [Candidatus Omnitrophica bacterium]|nr:glycosyltransferase family 1 protein [Candidatus Omnitrophota bacterium]
MRILQAHKYFFRSSGADQVFLNTVGLLRRHGEEVSCFSMRHPRNEPAGRDAGYFVSPIDLNQRGAVNALRATGRILYSLEARRRL